MSNLLNQLSGVTPQFTQAMNAFQGVEAQPAMGDGSLLESWGRTLVARLFPLNLWTALLFVAAFAVDRALSRHTRAAWRIALYAPVGMRIVCHDWDLRLANTPGLDTWLAPLIRIGGPAELQAGAPQVSFWYALATCMYLAIALLLALRTLSARWNLHRALANAEPLSELPPGIHGIGYSVLQHADLGPMAVGLLAPRIIIPRSLLQAKPATTLALILRHEAAHLRRLDGWLAAGLQLLIVVAWPVIPLWLASARVRQLMELACDEAALADTTARERTGYGHLLLDLAELRYAPLSAGVAGELRFGSTLRARIHALRSRDHWPALAQFGVLSLAGLLLCAACGGSAQRSAPVSGATSKERQGYGYHFDVDIARPVSAAPLPPPALVDGGRLPAEAIEGTLHEHASAFWACYASGLKKNPQLSGLVRVRLVFGTDGATQTAQNDASTLPDAEVVACVVREFVQITYPPSRAGKVTVVYPIQFGS